MDTKKKYQESNMTRSKMSQKIQVADILKTTFDKYLCELDGLDSFCAFMEDEKNLYDANGQPTEDYRKWLQKIEEYAREHSVKDCIANTSADNEPRELALDGIDDFLTLRSKLLKSLAQARLNSDFNIKEWMTKEMEKISDSEKETAQKVTAIEALINNNSITDGK